MTQSTPTQSNINYQLFLQNVIYESPDGGKTVRIRRQWSRDSAPLEFQLLDLLDMLYYCQQDTNLSELINQAFVYFNLKYKG
jgi:hypothetical protein